MSFDSVTPPQTLLTDLPPRRTPVLNDQQIRLLRRNFAVVEQQADIAALVFYRHLFTIDPALRDHFHTSMELQGRKLMEALQLVMATLENPDAVVPTLEAMGRRHVTYGTQAAHYVAMQQAILQTFREALGAEFTPAAEAAWQVALEFIIGAMLRGAQEMQDLMNG